MLVNISKDILSTFDPAIKDFYIKNNMINLVLKDGTIVINFKRSELESLLKTLEENINA